MEMVTFWKHKIHVYFYYPLYVHDFFACVYLHLSISSPSIYLHLNMYIYYKVSIILF